MANEVNDQVILVAGLKAALQKFKTDKVDPLQWPRVAVDTLPTASASTMHKIYLIPSAKPSQNNIKDEFITIATTEVVEEQEVTTYDWEQIGSTEADLTNYATTQALTNAADAVRSEDVAVTTLSSAPTSSTTTYTKSGQTINFKVGDEVRVADAEQATEDSNGYVYYKLYDLVESQDTKTAYWDLIGSSGDSVSGKITVSITPYINDAVATAAALSSVTVTLTNTTDSTTVQTTTWSGTDIVFSKLKPLKSYRVTVEDKTGWLRDKSYADVANLGIGEEESVSFTYSADEYTCAVSGTADGRIVVSNVEYANGETFRVAKNTSIAATAKAVSNYVTPTPTITSKTISATYVAYGYVSVTTSSNQGTDETIAAVSPTIKVGDTEAVTYSAPVLVAPDTQVIVTWPAVTGYKTPALQTFTKSGTTDESKSGTYRTEIVTVTVGTDETGVTAQGQVITINGGNYTVGSSGVVSAKVPFDTVYSVSANAWSGQDDYTTPASQTNITAAIASRSITMTYEKIRGTLYSLVVTDNLSGASNAATNANITVKYTKDNVETILGTTYKNGNTFLIPNGATNITVTGNASFGSHTNKNFAPSTTVSGTTYTVTYKAQKVTVSSNSSTTITLTNTTKSSTISSVTGTSTNGYVAWGDSWKVSAPATTSKYPSISPATGTANSASTTSSITMTSYTLITSGAADLGLPSGKLWAATNVGASNYYNEGLYFSWGDIMGHAKNSGYNFSSSNYSSGASGSGHNLTGDFTSGDATYDGARATMGGAWRTPTYDELNELKNNCTWIWTTLNSVNGYLVIKNSKAIFLPVSGFYNGTSLYNSGSYGRYWSTRFGNSSRAYYLYFNSSSKDVSHDSRYYGFSIRAIKDPEMVYLGPTSSPGGLLVYWASGNLTKDANGNYSIADPTNPGAYFSWGDIEGHNVAGQNEGYSFDQTNYNNGVSGSGHNLTADFSSGNATYDAARAKLGSGWRIPTYEELNWLINNCTWNWKASGNTDYNGVAGYEVVGTNGNKIFLPCAGYYKGTSLSSAGSFGRYWSTRYYSSGNACNWSFHSSDKYMGSNLRYYGFSIRPVYMPVGTDD